jgi:hypothetical protein
MPEAMYRQCRFKSDRNRLETAWIPEWGAKVGKRLYFDGKLDEVWTVLEVFAQQTESYVKGHRMDYRYQREVSDI